MPLIPTRSSSDLLYRNERRMLYAHLILKEQSFTQQETNRIDLVSGSAAVNSCSAILPMKLGAYFMDPEERASILGENRPNSQAIVIPNPVASYLPANGTASTWTDTVGSLNATMTGSPIYSPSLGYTFNGSSQYGRIASADGINNFNNTDSYTIELWFNPSSGQANPTAATVLEKSNNEPRYPYLFRYSETSSLISIRVFSTLRTPTINIVDIPTNTWVQIVCVFNFTTNLMTGYKNGAFPRTTSLANLGNVANASLVSIGHKISTTDGTTPQLIFKGSIGIIRFYNTALSEEQVSQLFTNTRNTFGI